MYEAMELDTTDSKVNTTVGEALWAFLPQLLPRFFGAASAETSTEMEWTGIMGYTRRGIPFVGRIPAQYIATGYTGHDVPRAYVCAEAIVGMIAAQVTKRRWTPPEWLPLPHSFLTPSTARGW